MVPWHHLYCQSPISLYVKLVELPVKNIKHIGIQVQTPHTWRLNKRAEWTKHFTLHQSSSYCPKCSLPEWSCLKLSPLLESSEAIVFNKDQAAGSQIKQRDKENLISWEPLNLKWCCLAARGEEPFALALLFIRFPGLFASQRAARRRGGVPWLAVTSWPALPWRYISLTGCFCNCKLDFVFIA